MGSQFPNRAKSTAYSDRFGAYWTPAGHKLVAERLLRLLSENNIIRTDDLLR
jgi:hypothetical protein